LERALVEAEDDARGETLTQLADTELRLGCFDAAVAHASEALELGVAPEIRVAACVAAAHAIALSASTPTALELLAAETEQIGEHRVDLQFGLRAEAATLRACAGTAGDPDEADVSATLAGTTPAERVLLGVCAADHVLRATASAPHVRELCARALGVDSAAEATASYFAGFAALRSDAGELVEPLLGNDPPATEIPADARVVRLALDAQLAFTRGELDRARRVALDVLEHVAATPDSALARRIRTDTLATLVLAALAAARREDAGEALTELSEQDNANASDVAALRVAVALADDGLDTAIDAAHALDAPPSGLTGPGLAGREWAALAWHAAGDRDSALAHATAHLDHARLWGGASLLGSALTVCGVVAAGGEQLGPLEEAVAILAETPSSLALARATIELGSALRRAGRRRDARERLVEAADLAYRCGAEALSIRARAELVSLGARPRRATFSGIDALTVSEHRVATLAAAGMTNRAIAHELTVSAKTVSGQLSAVYRKLDVHDRAALAAVMAEAAARSDAEAVEG
jgi:DNA-binding CsgD family transcriptional regulator